MAEKEDQSNDGPRGDILVVTPVWKDSSRLAVFGRELAKHLAQSGHDIEWMVADDGSGPEEREQLKKLHAEFGDVYGQTSLHFADAHRGKGAVVREAWSQRPDAGWYVFVDADGSLSPEELTRMIDVAHDVGTSVLAIRKRTKDTQVNLTLFRRIAHRIFILAVRLLVGVRCTDPQCGAKILKGPAFRDVADFLEEDGLAFDTEMLTALSENDIAWKELPVSWIERDGGRVKPWRDAWGMLAALWKIRGRRKRGEFTR